MWLGVLATAWGGPLDLPDAEEMSGFRCLERPIAGNNVPLLGRTLVAEPPGPPTFADGSPSLAPTASDADLKRAGRGRGLLVFPAVATLATGGMPVVADCEGPATDRDDFVRGCKLPLQCELLTSIDGARTTLASRPQAVARFAPVESATEAVGLVVFVEPDVFLPLTEGERARWAEEAAGYQRVEPAKPWLEVETHAEGWLVRAPRRVACGCEHDVVRRAWWVARDGRSCAVQEAPVPLAVATAPACMD